MKLSHSSSLLLRRVLIDNGLVQSIEEAPVEWPCVLSYVPDSPDQLIAIMDTRGDSLGRELLGVSFDTYGGQITVRVGVKDYDLGFSKLVEVVKLLDEIHLHDVVIDNDVYTIHQIWADRPQYAGREPENRRPLFISNVQMYITVNAGV